MALESAPYINGLVSANPPSGDPVTQADDHLRLIKAALLATFPSITGPITKTHTELNNTLDKAGGTMTGALVLAGAPTVDLNPATKLYADGLATSLAVSVAALVAAAMPTGAVLLWSGLVAAIPAGFHLCDGTSGTPDLRNKFIVGAGSTYAPAAVGGSKDAIAVAHTHTGTTVSGGTHTHDISTQSGTFGSGSGVGNIPNGAGTMIATQSAGAHTHTFTTDSTGASGTDANLPPYMALCYIMKL